MILNGKVYKYGDHVDTDVIIPARYLNDSNPKTLALHCMEDIDANYAKTVEMGDIIVAGINFGCGSSREHAPIAISASGASCIIAKSFARIFFRNSINTGLPILECEEAVNSIQAGDKLRVDTVTGVIKNLSKDEEYNAQPFPVFLLDIIESGGLLKSISKKKGETK